MMTVTTMTNGLIRLTLLALVVSALSVTLAQQASANQSGNISDKGTAAVLFCRAVGGIADVDSHQTHADGLWAITFNCRGGRVGSGFGCEFTDHYTNCWVNRTQAPNTHPIRPAIDEIVDEPDATIDETMSPLTVLPDATTTESAADHPSPSTTTSHHTAIDEPIVVDDIVAPTGPITEPTTSNPVITHVVAPTGGVLDQPSQSEPVVVVYHGVPSSLSGEATTED